MITKVWLRGTQDRPQASDESLDAYAEQVVAQAPPLTESQKDHIRRIFQPVAAGHRGPAATGGPQGADSSPEPIVLRCGPDETEAEFIARVVATAPPMPDSMAQHLAALLPLGQSTNAIPTTLTSRGGE